MQEIKRLFLGWHKHLACVLWESEQRDRRDWHSTGQSKHVMGPNVLLLLCSCEASYLVLALIGTLSGEWVFRLPYIPAP